MSGANGPHEPRGPSRDPELEVVASLFVELWFGSQLSCGSKERREDQIYFGGAGGGCWFPHEAHPPASSISSRNTRTFSKKVARVTPS